MMTILTARPEAITFDPQQSALIVVDMQNAYACLLYTSPSPRD